MPFAQKIILDIQSEQTEAALDDLVGAFMRDGVRLVAVRGRRCTLMEEIIDEMWAGDGRTPSPPYSLITTSHPGETLADVQEFCDLVDDFSGPAQVVVL